MKVTEGMKEKKMRKFATMFALLTLAGAAFASDLSYTDAKALADRDEAALGAGTAAFVQSQGENAAPIMGACVQKVGGGDLSPFVVVFELDAAGNVVRTWRQGESPIGACLAAEMQGRFLYKPAKAPFYTSIEMTFDR